VFQLIEGFIIPRAVDDVIIRQQATCPAAAPVSVLHTQAERMKGGIENELDKAPSSSSTLAVI
jgi:hypothetical protein